MRKLVIVGAGMASGRTLEHLLERAPEAFEITLFNAEPRGNYNRIMLSPVLAGDRSYEEIVTHDERWYAEHGIVTRFGEKVTAIDRERKVVVGERGEVPYDTLILATGSAPFIIPLPGHDLPGVVGYRDLEDTGAMIEAACSPGAAAVVIGGGLLGLEAAAGLRMRGMEVTVLHLNAHLMERQLDASAAYLLRQDLERRGIDIITEANTERIVGDGRAEKVRLADGTEIPADIVVMTAGIRPAVGIAADAGLEMGRAIVVDAQLRTSDPDVFAVGECVEFEGHLFGLVAPLYDQARVLANTLLGEDDAFVARELSTKLKVTGLRSLQRRGLRRRRRARGHRLPRPPARRLQASRHRERPADRRGHVRRHRRRQLVLRAHQGRHRHRADARDADLRAGLPGGWQDRRGPSGSRCSLAA